MTNGLAARSDRPSVSTDPETGRTVDRLTDSEYHDVHAYYDKSPWSPSGNRLVFSSAEPEEIIDVRNPSRRTERFYKSGGGHGYTDEGALYLMNADGRNKELLVDDAVFTTHTGCVPTWIPERGTIAYGENRHGFGGEWRLYLVDLETDERVALTDLFPRMVHPEGETMLCQSSRGVVVLDLDTLDQEVVLTEEELFEASPHDSSEFYDPRVANLKWSPDGSEFILRIRAAGRKIKELYLVGADGSNLRRVTAASTSFHHHSWHPDGERLLYGDRNQDDEPRLYFTPEDALDEKELISEEPLGGHPSVNRRTTRRSSPTATAGSSAKGSCWSTPIPARSRNSPRSRRRRTTPTPGSTPIPSGTATGPVSSITPIVPEPVTSIRCLSSEAAVPIHQDRSSPSRVYSSAGAESASSPSVSRCRMRASAG
jgi:Tol biopolymer transport system component